MTWDEEYRRLSDEIRRLRATIVELVVVLEKVESAISSDALVAQPGYSDDLTALNLIRAAIARAKGES